MLYFSIKQLYRRRYPSQSAFNQRRSQISLSAFKYLFSEFSSSFPTTTNNFKNHCILVCDDCRVVYTTNSKIIEDYNKPRLIDYKGYNHMHLNYTIMLLQLTLSISTQKFFHLFTTTYPFPFPRTSKKQDKIISKILSCSSTTILYYSSLILLILYPFSFLCVSI